MFTEFW